MSGVSSNPCEHSGIRLVLYLYLIEPVLWVSVSALPIVQETEGQWICQVCMAG